MDISIYIVDVPLSGFPVTSIVTASLKAIDLEAGEIAIIQNVDGKGFGSSYGEARSNALKEASHRVPAHFIKMIAKISGKPVTGDDVLGSETSTVGEIARGRTTDVTLAPRDQVKLEVTIATPSVSIDEGYPSALFILGRGWDGSTRLKVFVNGRDVSAYIDSQSKHSVDLKGSLENLNLLDGQNEVVVEAGGIKSKPYVFRKSISR